MVVVKWLTIESPVECKGASIHLLPAPLPATPTQWVDIQPTYSCVEKHIHTPGSHLEERLLDQAQARASYTPLFWGHSRSIPQGMVLDVQPLVKSLFCPIRASPNGFFDFEASTP